MNRIELGDMAKDKLTGFTGYVGARFIKAFSVARFRLDPVKLKDDGSVQASNWFDETVLEVVEKQFIKPEPPVQHTFQLLDKVKDSVTNFSGSIIGFIEHASGCVTAIVVPAELKDGKPQDESDLPVQQLVLVVPKAVPNAAPNAAPQEKTFTGGPRVSQNIHGR